MVAAAERAAAREGMPKTGPRGFKQTEIGPIPEDWEVVAVGHFQPYITSGSRGWAKYYAGTGDPFLRITNLARADISMDLTDLRYVRVAETDAEAERTRVSAGDVLISITADIGIIGYVSDELPSPAYINQHISLVRFNPDSVNPKFAAYYLASNPAQSFFRAITDSGAKAGINLETVRNLVLPLPPLAEQEAIAGALSDADGAIRAVERTLAKQRAVKQAALHALLRPTTRLPGFSGDWETKTLGELGTFLKGSGVRKDEAQSGSIPCVRYGELYTDHHDVIRAFRSRISSGVASKATRLRYGDILFAGSGETKEEIGKSVAFAEKTEAFAGGDIVILRISDAEPVFLGYALNMPAIQRQKASKGQGDAVVHISSAALAAIEISLPPLPEQRAIAAVLSGMDAAIAALEARRDKLKAIKQGMMQTLLTGKVRLV